MTKNEITQLSPIHYIMFVFKSIPTEHRCPGYIDTKTITPQLTLIAIPEDVPYLHKI